MGGRTARRGRPARRLLIDLTPVRRSRDLRRLVLGELISVFGTQLTTVAVFRSTIIQLAVPDALRGRLSGLQIAVVTGGPRVGDLEAGAVAAGFGDTVSVVSGGLACIAGALLLARLLPASAISGRRRRRRYVVDRVPRADRDRGIRRPPERCARRPPDRTSNFGHGRSRPGSG